MDITNSFLEKKDYEFREAKKMIYSKEELDVFLKGQTFRKIMEFICFMQNSVEGKCRKETIFPEDVSNFFYFKY